MEWSELGCGWLLGWVERLRRMQIGSRTVPSVIAGIEQESLPERMATQDVFSIYERALRPPGVRPRWSRSASASPLRPGLSKLGCNANPRILFVVDYAVCARSAAAAWRVHV